MKGHVCNILMTRKKVRKKAKRKRRRGRPLQLPIPAHDLLSASWYPKDTKGLRGPSIHDLEQETLLSVNKMKIVLPPTLPPPIFRNSSQICEVAEMVQW